MKLVAQSFFMCLIALFVFISSLKIEIFTGDCVAVSSCCETENRTLEVDLIFEHPNTNDCCSESGCMDCPMFCCTSFVLYLQKIEEFKIHINSDSNVNKTKYHKIYSFLRDKCLDEPPRLFI